MHNRFTPCASLYLVLLLLLYTVRQLKYYMCLHGGCNTFLYFTFRCTHGAAQLHLGTRPIDLITQSLNKSAWHKVRKCSKKYIVAWKERVDSNLIPQSYLKQHCFKTFWPISDHFTLSCFPHHNTAQHSRNNNKFLKGTDLLVTISFAFCFVGKIMHCILLTKYFYRWDDNFIYKFPSRSLTHLQPEIIAG